MLGFAVDSIVQESIAKLRVITDQQETRHKVKHYDLAFLFFADFFSITDTDTQKKIFHNIPTDRAIINHLRNYHLRKISTYLHIHKSVLHTDITPFSQFRF